MKRVLSLDALTNYHDDGKPVTEETIINPPSNLQADPTPIFNTSTGKCLQGGSSGAQLTTATCNGSEKQQFKFHGAFMEQGSSQQCTTLSSGKVTAASCSGSTGQWTFKAAAKK